MDVCTRGVGVGVGGGGGVGGGNNKMQLHDKITPKSRPYSMRRRRLTHSGTLRLKQQQQQQKI